MKPNTLKRTILQCLTRTQTKKKLVSNPFIKNFSLQFSSSCLFFLKFLVDKSC